MFAGLAITAAVIGGVLAFGGLQDQDLAVLGGFVFFGFIGGIFLIQVAQTLFAGASLNALIRGVMSIIFLAVFISIANSLLKEWSPQALIDALPAFWAYVENYPFSFVLVGAFAMVNGLFFYLLRSPTALGRPIMDQLAGLRLYLETAESDRLNLNTPEITAERFEALLPYAVALDVEKPWSDAFAAALRRAHPGDPDPDEPLPLELELKRQLVEQQFRQLGFIVDRGGKRCARQRGAGLVRLVRLLRRWRRRIGRRRRRRRWRRLVKLAGARDSHGPPC